MRWSSIGMTLVAVLLMIRPAGCQETWHSLISGIPSGLGCPEAASLSVDGNLLISPDDRLEVRVFDVPQLSGKYRVNPDGFIVLPLAAAPVRAAGRTPGELSQAIGAELRVEGLVSDPRVTVEVKESRLHSVVIGGAVNKPQIYPLFGHTTLLDALAQAGGLSQDAGDTAIITRGRRAAGCGSDDQKPAAKLSAIEPSSPDLQHSGRVTVNLKELMEEGNPGLNIDL